MTVSLVLRSIVAFLNMLSPCHKLPDADGIEQTPTVRDATLRLQGLSMEAEAGILFPL
jgi:hypothetical protein